MTRISPSWAERFPPLFSQVQNIFFCLWSYDAVNEAPGCELFGSFSGFGLTSPSLIPSSGNFFFNQGLQSLPSNLTLVPFGPPLRPLFPPRGIEVIASAPTEGISSSAVSILPVWDPHGPRHFSSYLPPSPLNIMLKFHNLFWTPLPSFRRIGLAFPCSTWIFYVNELF